MNTTAGALARFWWIVLFGLVAGGAAAVAIYSLEAPAKHTATARLMVNSPAAPYLRTQQPLLKAQATRVGGVGKAKLQSITQQAPDTQTLVNAANLYPLLIESDRIAQLREVQTGPIQGTIKAAALNASTNTYGVFRPSVLPVIEVKATSKHSADAEELATETIAAFSRWMVAEQRTHGIPVSQRIAVQQLKRPALATTGGPSYGLPLFVGVLVLLGFCGLAVVADHAWPATAEARTRETAPGTAASPHLDG